MRDSIKQERRQVKIVQHSALNEALAVARQSHCRDCTATGTDLEMLWHERQAGHKIDWRER